MREISAQRGEKADHFETEARDHHDVCIWEGKSIREISRVTGLHRKTVTRYVHAYEENRAK